MADEEKPADAVPTANAATEEAEEAAVAAPEQQQAVTAGEETAAENADDGGGGDEQPAEAEATASGEKEGDEEKKVDAGSKDESPADGEPDKEGEQQPKEEGEPEKEGGEEPQPEAAAAAAKAEAEEEKPREDAEEGGGQEPPAPADEGGVDEPPAPAVEEGEQEKPAGEEGGPAVEAEAENAKEVVEDAQPVQDAAEPAPQDGGEKEEGAAEPAQAEGQKTEGAAAEEPPQAEGEKEEDATRPAEAKEGAEPVAVGVEKEDTQPVVAAEGGEEQSPVVPPAQGGEEQVAAPEQGGAKEAGQPPESAAVAVQADQEEKQETAMFPLPKLDATATVKFVLQPSGQVSTLASPLKQSVANWRAYFSGELKMVEKLIIIQLEGKRLDGKVTIGDLGVPANGMIQLEIVSADPVNHPLKSLKPKAEYVMPDVITVRVQTAEEAEYQDIVVEIERSRFGKPFLGGYKHKLTGAEYHHAAAQTAQRARADTGVERYCRDTQTVSERQQLQQVTMDTSTQMTGVGVYVANLTDKLLTPGHYTTADQLHATILQKIIVLQSYFRRWQARRTVAAMRRDLARRLDWERQEEVRKIQEKEARIKREFERRMDPKSKEDFDLLYAALEKWRREELEVIDSSAARSAERKAELCQLLDEETQLITAIGRHKIQADNENKQRRIQRFLDQASAPKKWKAYDGKFTEMDTPYTIRARELKDIYSSINMKYLTQDERLDVLLTLKHTVKEHDCKLTQEIVDLIDREADLLMRGVKEANLEGLRKRISTLFLQYIRTPTFNPEAARLLKVPQDPSVLRKNIYFCSSCNRYLPSTDFQLASNSRLVGRCRLCHATDNQARQRQDLGHFRYMLKLLRATEEHYADDSRIAFLVQEADLRYLVENIWSCQSALSSWDDLFDLTLVRWDSREEWSPWNCVLLTKDEAAAHMKLQDLEESYGRVFCHKVASKHTLARNYFSRLPGMVQLMRKREAAAKPGATATSAISSSVGSPPLQTATTTPS